MTEERLLGDLCQAEALPQPLYDLEVSGSDLVTVCCVVGRYSQTSHVPLWPSLQAESDVD